MRDIPLAIFSLSPVAGTRTRYLHQALRMIPHNPFPLITGVADCVFRTSKKRRRRLMRATVKIGAACAREDSANCISVPGSTKHSLIMPFKGERISPNSIPRPRLQRGHEMDVSLEVYSISGVTQKIDAAKSLEIKMIVKRKLRFGGGWMDLNAAIQRQKKRSKRSNA